MLLSKATYNWGVHKAINLEEANINTFLKQLQVLHYIYYYYYLNIIYNTS